MYKEYGYYAEKTVNLVMPGIDGLEKMKLLMAELRRVRPSVIGGKAVTKVRDYLTGKAHLPSGTTENLPLMGSDVLYFELGRQKAIERPSEPSLILGLYLVIICDTAAASRSI
jgi:phosphoglucomutase